MVVIQNNQGDEIDIDYYTNVKGQIISDFIVIERRLNEVIIAKIQPADKEFFKNIVLNSSILGIGQKIKILNNIDNIDSSIIKPIREMNSIRNGFAHVNFSHTLSVGKNNAGAKTEIVIMNAEGKLKRKNADELIDTYVELSNKVHSLLDSYLRTNKSNICQHRL